MSTLAHARAITRCARCNRKLTAATSTYSRWTKTHYCADLAGCDKRTKPARKKAA